MNRTQKLLLWAALFLTFNQIFVVAAVQGTSIALPQYAAFVLVVFFLSQAFYVSGRTKR